MAAKDNLKDLLQERFTDHEVGVDPGLWQAISGQLAAVAPAADGLSDMLKDRFQQHEADVDPGTWSQISSQLGHGAAAGGAGFGGWIAAGLAATLITGAAFFYTAGPDASEPVSVAVVTTPVQPVPAPIEEPVVTAATTPSSLAAGSNGTTTPSQQSNRPNTSAKLTPPEVPLTGSAAESGAIDRDQHRPEATQPEGARVVNMIIEQLRSQTQAAPLILQTESIPNVGLVQGQEDIPPQDDVPPPATEEPALAPAPTLWIPNAFSPGMRDGVNDDLVVKAEGLKNIQVRIYSMGSQLVFKASSTLELWDGRDLGGQPCQEGYYFYAIEGLDGNDKPFSKGQTIHLFR